MAGKPIGMDIINAYHAGKASAVQEAQQLESMKQQGMQNFWQQQTAPITLADLIAKTQKELAPINPERIRQYTGNLGDQAISQVATDIQTNPTKAPEITPSEVEEFQQILANNPNADPQKAAQYFLDMKGLVKGKAAPAKPGAKKIGPQDLKRKPQSEPPVMNDLQSPVVQASPAELPIKAIQTAEPTQVTAQQLNSPYGDARVPQSSGSTPYDLLKYAVDRPVESVMPEAERQIVTQGIGLQAANLRYGLGTAQKRDQHQAQLQFNANQIKAINDVKAAIANQQAQQKQSDTAQKSTVEGAKIAAGIDRPAKGAKGPDESVLRARRIQVINNSLNEAGWSKLDEREKKKMKFIRQMILPVYNAQTDDVRREMDRMFKFQLDKAKAEGELPGAGNPVPQPAQSYAPGNVQSAPIFRTSPPNGPAPAVIKPTPANQGGLDANRKLLMKLRGGG